MQGLNTQSAHKINQVIVYCRGLIKNLVHWVTMRKKSTIPTNQSRNNRTTLLYFQLTK